MALIPCPECQHQVSSTAAACPGCGAPIASKAEVAATGAPVQTLQETSKRLKSQVLIASLLFWAGVALLIVSMSNGGSAMAVWGAVATVAGLCYYMVVRYRIWWHHK